MKKFDWIKYHELANKMYEQEHEEYIRSAISRDYYACFNLLKNYLIEEKRYYNNYSSKSHKEVSLILQTSKNEKEEKIGKTLNKFRKIRNKADYNSDIETSKILLKSKITYQKYSKIILENLNELKN